MVVLLIQKIFNYCSVEIFNGNKGKCRPFNYMKLILVKMTSYYAL